MAYLSSLLTVFLVLISVGYCIVGGNPYLSNKLLEGMSAKKNTAHMKDEASLKGKRFYVPREKRDVRVNLYRMHENLPVMFFAHGGGFEDSDADQSDDLCAELAERLHCAVVSISYSNFRVHRTTYPQEEICDTIVYFLVHADDFGIQKDRPVLAGIDAGAYLILQSGISAVQKSVLTGGYILIDPFIDYVCISLAKAHSHPGPLALLFSDRSKEDLQQEYIRALDEDGLSFDVKDIVLYTGILENMAAEGDEKAARDGVMDWLKEEADSMFHRYEEDNSAVE